MTTLYSRTLRGPYKCLRIFEKGIGKELPEAYQKFYKEWKVLQPAAVHHIPETELWKRNDETGEVKRADMPPIPVKYPIEHDQGLWGGEGIIQGFQKRGIGKRRVPHFWVPVLKRSVVYSEVLNKHMAVIVTDRTIQLIHDHYGFDHYLLKTPACDLKSLLALGLKRKILQSLEKGCPEYDDTPEKKEEVYNRYKQYLSAYTSEEIKWYGYSFFDACKILMTNKRENNIAVPLKVIYREQLLEELRNPKNEDGSESGDLGEISRATSWMQKFNPFSKKQVT